MTTSPPSFWTSFGFRVLSPTLTHANTVIPWAPAVIDSFSQASTAEQASAVALGVGIWGILNRWLVPHYPTLEQRAGPELREALRAARGLDSLAMDRRNRALGKLRRLIPHLTDDEVGELSVSIAKLIRETDFFIHRDQVGAICSFFSRLNPHWVSQIADIVADKIWISQNHLHEELAPFLGELASRMDIEARPHLYDRFEHRCAVEEEGYHRGSSALIQLFDQLDRTERLGRVERFLEEIEEKSPRDRRTIAETGWVLLTELLPDEQKMLAPRLLMTLRDEDAVVRRYSADKALFIVGRLHPHVRLVTARHLARLLDDTSPEIIADVLRRFRLIIMALPAADLLRAVARMIELLDHQKPYLREQAGSALASLLPCLANGLRKVVFDTLIKALETGDSRFQSNVIRELTRIAGELPHEDRLQMLSVIERTWEKAVDWLRPDLLDAARDVSFHLPPKDQPRVARLYLNALGSSLRNLQQRAALEWPSLLTRLDIEDRLDILRELVRKPKDQRRFETDLSDGLLAATVLLTPIQRIELVRTLLRAHRLENVPLKVLSRYLADIPGGRLREYAFRVQDADLVILSHYHESGLPYESRLWERYLELTDPSDFLKKNRKTYRDRLRTL